MINSRSLNDLREDVRLNAKTLLNMCEAQGLQVLVTNTYRDEEYQEYCFSIGTSNTPLLGFHGKGLAFDVCQNIKGHEYDDIQFFENVATIAKSIGFSWGGDWRSYPDRPHFQWDSKGMVTTSALRKGAIPGSMPEYKFMTKYETVNDLPKWAKASVNKAISAGVLSGTSDGKINLSEDLARTIVILDRLDLIPE